MSDTTQPDEEFFDTSRMEHKCPACGRQGLHVCPGREAFMERTAAEQAFWDRAFIGALEMDVWDPNGGVRPSANRIADFADEALRRRRAAFPQSQPPP